MALIKCKECGTEVSTKATVCPKCGAPASSGKIEALALGLRKMGFGTILILSLLFAWVSYKLSPDGSSNTGQSQFKSSPDSATPNYVLTADQLYGDYSANEVAADAKYKGKIVLVRGVIDDIGKDILDDAYIVIGGRGGFLDGVQCTFAKDKQHLSVITPNKALLIRNNAG